MRLRGDVPNVPSAFAANAAVLKYWLIVCAVERGGRYGLPVRSARSRPTPDKDRSCPEMIVNGVPLRQVRIPVTPHPLKTERTTRPPKFTFGKSQRPLIV